MKQRYCEQSQGFPYKLRLLRLQCRLIDLSYPQMLQLRSKRHRLQLRMLRSNQFPLRMQTPFGEQAHQRMLGLNDQLAQQL